MAPIKPGRYQHFKGNFYEVLGVGRNSETKEEVVIYKALYESKEYGKNALWVRPKTHFQEVVSHNGKLIPRFKFVS
jgi:hypothetical protein